MNLYYTIKKWLNLGHIEKHTEKFPVFHYEVEHINGSTKDVYAIRCTIEGGMFTFWDLDDSEETERGNVATPFIDSINVFPEQEAIKKLGAVQEISKEVHCWNQLEAIVDRADGSVIRSMVVEDVEKTKNESHL